MIDEYIKVIFFSIGAFVSWMIGGVGILLTALLAMMLLDIITGLLNSWVHKQTSSSIGREGLIKKVYILLLIGAIYIMEYVAGQYTGQELTVFEYVGDGAAAAYLVMEFISVLENGIKLNIKFPEFIIKGLKIYQELKHK